MVSIKAQQEINKLKGEMNELERQNTRNNERYSDPKTDTWLRKHLAKENNSIWTKKNNKENKINTINEFGYATLEMSGLKRELSGFTSLTHSSSMGSRDRTVVGFSKKLGKYVIVKYTKWTGMMRNVRGCSSMAGNTDINSLKVISKAQYDSITKQEKKPTRRPTGWESRRNSASVAGFGSMFK